MNNIVPGLYLVATPIGNLGDISKRAIEVFKAADVIACEDTREAKKLLQLLEIEHNDKSFVSLHDHNEFDDAQKVLDEISNGKVVVYCSDAGMPAISDPGAILVDTAHQQNLTVTCIPGPSAVVSAYALSGFKSTSFEFIGFLPKTHQAKLDVINLLKTKSTPVIFYESPNRLRDTLSLIADTLSNRQVFVARELTKKYEQLIRGTAQEVLMQLSDNIKGEIVVVVDKTNDEAHDQSEEVDKVSRAVEIMKQSGISSKDCVEILTAFTQMSKNEIKQMYQEVNILKSDEK